MSEAVVQLPLLGGESGSTGEPTPARRGVRGGGLRIAEYCRFPRASAAHGWRAGFVRDLSDSGLCLEVEQGLPIGSLLRVTLRSIGNASPTRSADGLGGSLSGTTGGSGSAAAVVIDSSGGEASSSAGSGSPPNQPQPGSAANSDAINPAVAVQRRITESPDEPCLDAKRGGE